jgi:hypothetical protein
MKRFCLLRISGIFLAGVLAGGISPAGAEFSGVIRRIHIPRQLENPSAVIFGSEVQRTIPRIERVPVKMEQETGGGFVAEISLPDDAVERWLTIVGTLPGSGITASPIQSLSAGEENTARISASCAESDRNTAHQKLSALKATALKQLVDIREKKRELLLQRLRSQLTPPIVHVLRAAEEAYGLTTQPPFSADLPAEQLLWRLAVIQSMARNRLGK